MSVRCYYSLLKSIILDRGKIIILLVFPSAFFKYFFLFLLLFSSLIISFIWFIIYPVINNNTAAFSVLSVCLLFIHSVYCMITVCAIKYDEYLIIYYRGKYYTNKIICEKIYTIKKKGGNTQGKERK